jgi:hypothetical protein
MWDQNKAEAITNILVVVVVVREKKRKEVLTVEHQVKYF